MRKSRVQTTEGFYARLHAKLQTHHISVLIKGLNQASIFLMEMKKFNDVDDDVDRIGKMFVQVGLRFEEERGQKVKVFPDLKSLVKWVDTE
jgi:hypothetical protein